MAVFFVVFAENLIRIFTHDPQVIPFGVDALRYISYGYFFYAYGMVLTQSFNGAGDTYTPTLINLICFWAVQIPLAYYLSLKTPLGAGGVFIAVTVAESLLAVMAMVAFRLGRWKHRHV